MPIDLYYSGINLESTFGALRRLLDQYRPMIGENKFKVASNVVLDFEDWYLKGHKTADGLYALVEMSDTGEGIFEYAECWEDNEPEGSHYLWQVVLSVLMAITSIAYDREGVEPQQDIGIIRVEKIEEFLALLNNPLDKPKEIFAFYQNVVCNPWAE